MLGGLYPSKPKSAYAKSWISQTRDAAQADHLAVLKSTMPVG
jgi:hypothetical protein